jgi:hypothetical protein
LKDEEDPSGGGERQDSLSMPGDTHSDKTIKKIITEMKRSQGVTLLTQN